jgi:hypothetical protein
MSIFLSCFFSLCGITGYDINSPTQDHPPGSRWTRILTLTNEQTTQQSFKFSKSKQRVYGFTGFWALDWMPGSREGVLEVAKPRVHHRKPESEKTGDR